MINGAPDMMIDFLTPTGKRAGQLVQDADGTTWLQKHVHTGRHQLRRPPAWAADDDHLERLREIGAVGIRLEDESGNAWSATLDQFEQHGFPVRRGHGHQTGLVLSRWVVRRRGQPASPEEGNHAA
jgi:hypothetical protein